MAEGHVDGLLDRIARGDTDALTAVYDQVASPVYGLVHRIVKDETRSGQVTEEVLLEVWRTASRFNPSAGSGLAWIIAIAQRHAVRAARSPAGVGLLTHPDIASLPGPQREAVLLACCGYTWREVADLAGVPVGTAAGRLHDGLLQLRSRGEPVSL